MISCHIQCFLRSPKSAHLRILKYCSGEREGEGLVGNGSSSTWKRGDRDASIYFSPLPTVYFQEKKSASALPRGEREGQAELRSCC